MRLKGKSYKQMYKINIFAVETFDFSGIKKNLEIRFCSFGCKLQFEVTITTAVKIKQARYLLKKFVWKQKIAKTMNAMNFLVALTNIITLGFIESTFFHLKTY